MPGLRLTQLLLFLLLGVDNTRQQPDQVYLYRTSGDTVTLPFQNRIPDGDPGCVSTEWIHTGNYFASVTVAENGLIQAGELSPSKADRLCLESNCSLTVRDVSAEEDAGFYTVRQYEDGERRGYDQRIYLSVLEVSDVTGGDGGAEEQTLQCSLSAMDRSCGVHTLSWINDDGSLIKSMSGCSTTLTVDKRRPANKVRCLLIVHGELRTFVVFPEEKREKTTTSKVCTGTSPVDYTTDAPPTPDSALTVLIVRPTVMLLILLLQFIVQYNFWKWKATRGQKAEVKNTEMDYVNVAASRS